MIHLYCGDGKGKTTAAMGLALRAAGHGKTVVVAQFLKAGGSGERTILAGLPTVELLPVPEQMTFTFRMTPEERAAESARERALLEEAFRRGGEADVLVLGRAVRRPSPPAWWSWGGCWRCWTAVRRSWRWWSTGRNPPPELTARADYMTEMVKTKTPLRGGRPRPGGHRVVKNRPRLWPGAVFRKRASQRRS